MQSNGTNLQQNNPDQKLPKQVGNGAIEIALGATKCTAPRI